MKTANSYYDKVQRLRLYLESELQTGDSKVSYLVDQSEKRFGLGRRAVLARLETMRSVGLVDYRDDDTDFSVKYTGRSYG